jgi:hypothetical protein
MVVPEPLSGLRKDYLERCFTHPNQLGYLKSGHDIAGRR